MAEKRQGFAPYSLAREAGVQSATVNGTIDVIQEIRPTIETGFVDDKGDWKGRKSSDEQFHAFDKHVGIPNGGEMLTPQQISDTRWPIDMTGYNDIFIAIKPTNGGSYGVKAVMGPDTNSFANLTPVNPAAVIRGAGNLGDDLNEFATLLNDTSETCTANVWNIFKIYRNLSGQKLLQFLVTNSTGGESDVEFAFLRTV
jgi:hypothetical protein